MGILAVQCLESAVTLTELETRDWSKRVNQAWYKARPGCHQDLSMGKSFQFGGLPRGPLRDHRPLNSLQPNQAKTCLSVGPRPTWIFRKSRAPWRLDSQKPRVRSLKTKIRCYPLALNRDTLSTGSTCCRCPAAWPAKTLPPRAPRSNPARTRATLRSLLTAGLHTLWFSMTSQQSKPMI